MTDEQIFDQVIQLPVGERAAFLASECKDRPELRTRIEALIAAHEQADSLLDTEAMAVEETSVERPIHQTVGDFEVICELGRGGMGVVYEARQKSLNRNVALKMLSSGLGLSSRAILRFRREAEAAGKLHHTNIVPIYTTGEERGIHFYAMELIDGPSLDRVIRELRNDEPRTEAKRDAESASDDVPSWLRETALYSENRHRATESDSESDSASDSTISSGAGYFDTIATMIADVADALDHAHEHGVIHRDVKPSNLLLAPDGRLSINDFGLARMLEQPGMTMTGEFVGSPLYMSPEQITAGRAPLDHRTDIYSLGATLYELLTLRPPFPGESRDQVIAKVLHKDPASPRKLNRRVPVDLDTICMKAIEKDPDKRYQTAGKFAEDLRHYVNRRAISARRLGPIGKSLRFCKRNPLVVCLLALLLVIGAGAVWIAKVNHEQQQEQLDFAKATVTDLAMAGQFQQAREKLADAVDDGLSTGWEQLLRGQILLFEGNDLAARSSLERATVEMPESSSVRSLLAISYFSSGYEDEYLARLKTVSGLPVTDYTDRLFKGYALHWFAPELAMPLLDAAVHESHGTHLAALRLRSQALHVYSQDLPDRREALSFALQAKNDLVHVRDYWNVNPDFNRDLMNVFLLLGLIYRDLDNKEESKACFDQARQITDLMRGNVFDSEPAALPLLNFHLVTNADDELITLIRDQLSAGHRGSLSRDGYFDVMAPTLFYGRDSRMAREIYDCAPTHLREMTAYIPAFLACDASEADRASILADLRRHLPRRMDASKYTGIYLLLDWIALRMLNANRKLLDDVADHIHNAYDTYFIGLHRQRGLVLADYMRGRATTEDLQRITCQSRGLAVYAHLTVAANHLAEGNRAESKLALQASVDAGFYEYYAYKWSKAFLRRVDDPTWLPWLTNDTVKNDDTDD